MQGRGSRACVAAAILLTLLIPVVSSPARTKQDLRENQALLRELRRDIRRHSAARLSLRDRVAGLNRSITKTQIVVNEIDADITRIRSTVRSSRVRIAAMQTQMDAIKDAATEQAVVLYKLGGMETLSALLDAGSLTEFNDRIEMLGIATRKNIGVLVRYGRLQGAIEAQNHELFSKEKELATKRRAEALVLAQRNSLKLELAAELAKLQKRLGHEKTREGNLEHEADKLKEKIVAAQARNAAEALGTSAQGFIWPLNGPVTSPYGPRWGSMHTGIDIDGYTGQPIVASKAGVVIYIGAGMSGYGNAVVLDHGGGISTLYAHMSEYNTSSGASVRQGEIVGYVGCTGHCFGDHLHFEVRVNGNPVDPRGYLP